MDGVAPCPVEVKVMTAQPKPNRQDELHNDEVMNLKRNIIMDLLAGVLNTPRKESSVELWKAFVDTALDRLENDVYSPFIQADRQAILDEVFREVIGLDELSSVFSREPDIRNNLRHEQRQLLQKLREES